MCGRSRCALAPEQVEQAAGVQPGRWTDRERYRPSYNVQPGHWTPIVRMDEQQQQRMLQTMKWGLVPSFTKPGETPDHFRMFNARSESATEKPVFSRLLSRQRCVVLTEGFYEWKADAGGRKQPYYVSFGEGSVMRMAGLYDVWAGGPDGPLATYTIMTVDACPNLTWLLNRMLPKQRVE
ncbi:hypothetical protein OEZ85_005411 [Tetradesmus obliquus]|uniref:Embryonic stem cell-specific 5-hydroxymethylcytosine-binding protein n=1 Tax=Tetradesmus obliquus TaxID=3088 RepID=A0ABY8ULG4_TETOB|nr:hypothetical protein OEZ85_005411 [Tetradesmus obliquus]